MIDVAGRHFRFHAMPRCWLPMPLRSADADTFIYGMPPTLPLLMIDADA